MRFTQSFSTPLNVPNLLQRVWRANTPLTMLSLAMLPLIIIAMLGLVIDHQLITGAPAWMKPLKFAISIAIYCFSFGYLLTFVRGHQRLVNIVGTITAICLAVEMALIVLQVIRGTTSHFNFTTPFDSVVYESMGAFITILWLAGFVQMILLLLQRLPDPAWAWALRFSIIIALVGMTVAFIMIAQPGKVPNISGAHSIGVADGGPGLPLLGWSTIGGDLRVPHFFGLHGLQALLIVGWLVTMTRSWLNVRYRMALVITAGVGYLGFVALLTWQALRGQSIVRPDALTWMSASLLIAAFVVAVSLILLKARQDSSYNPNKIS